MANRMALMAGVTGLMPIAYRAACASQSPAGALEAQASITSQLDEVVITAERQTRNLPNTPVAAAAVTAQQLESRGARNIFGLQNPAPSLSIAQQSSQGGASGAIFYRGGLGGGAVARGSEASGTLYSDDFYKPSASANAPPALEREPVEALRGPQALFDRNAVGGVIRYAGRRRRSRGLSRRAEQTGNSDWCGSIPGQDIEAASSSASSPGLAPRVQLLKPVRRRPVRQRSPH